MNILFQLTKWWEFEIIYSLKSPKEISPNEEASVSSIVRQAGVLCSSGNDNEAAQGQIHQYFRLEYKEIHKSFMLCLFETFFY